MKKRKATRKRKPRKEYGVGTFLDYASGLAQSAKRVQNEERILKSFDPSGKPIN